MYQVKLTKQALKAFDHLMKSQPSIGRRIAEVIDSLSENPTSGVALKGKLKGCFKYRVGTYRIIYQIFHSQLLVMVLDLGHRKEVYR